MNNLKYLPRFIHHCMTIGEIPASYKISMTYEEQLLWFCKFLEEQVIPVVNNNSEVVQELKTYVETYFDNLDVQDEINNKLEEMAESGQLTDIIAQYLQLAGLLCFNTKADLKAAQNLSDGSFAKTYGTSSYNDGYGYFYKIRQIQNTDVVDDDNIIALTNYNNLIAEKIIDANITNINTQIANLQAAIESSHILPKKYIFIGDSYNTTDTPQGGVPIVPWSTPLVNYLGLTSSDYYNSGVSGAGWINGNTFLNQLQTLENSMTEDIKNSITDIVVAGGVNDMAEDVNDLYTAIDTFTSYVKLHFPNAMITFAPISWSKSDSVREFMRSALQVYINEASNSNYRCIPNAFTWFHNYLLYQPDGHPNASGSRVIAYYMANFLKGGENCTKWKDSGNITSTDNTLSISGSTIGTFQEIFSNDTESLRLSISNLALNNKTIVLDQGNYVLGKVAIHSGYFPSKYNLGIVDGLLYSGSTFTPFTARLIINQDGSLEISFNGTGASVSNVTLLIIRSSTFYSIPAEYC